MLNAPYAFASVYCVGFSLLGHGQGIEQMNAAHNIVYGFRTSIGSGSVTEGYKTTESVT